jgi:hypothetical protein
MRTTTTERAREIAGGYATSADRDREMTRFSSTGQADGYELLQCIERDARELLEHPEYPPQAREEIRAELDYLRTWVREVHGRYAVCVDREVWTEDEESDGESTDTADYLMFETLSEVADYMFKNGVDHVRDDGQWTARTMVQSARTEFHGTTMRDYVAVPVPMAERITVTPESGFSDRAWCAVILSVKLRFARVGGRLG